MEELTFKLATFEDYDDFYYIKCDPENVIWSGFPSVPDYDRMKEWFQQQLEGKKRTIYLSQWNGRVSGFFYLDNIALRGTDTTAQEISYGVLSEFTGKGIGTAIVQKAIQICNTSQIVAWVSEKNRASERCFEKNGFEKQQKRELRYMTSSQEFHYFYFWTKKIR